jgi:predicted nuclease of predicted toxin-antitoxin system
LSAPLLLDENFPAPSVQLLRSRGVGVLSISEFHCGLADTKVLALAVDGGRWLATFDLDFGELLYARGLAAPPAMLLLRVPRYRPDEPAAWVARWLATEPPPIGLFSVFDGESLRTRPLPHPG